MKIGEKKKKSITLHYSIQFKTLTFGTSSTIFVNPTSIICTMLTSITLEDQQHISVEAASSKDQCFMNEHFLNRLCNFRNGTNSVISLLTYFKYNGDYKELKSDSGVE